MRVWFIPVTELCDLQVLGFHRELHMLMSMINNPRFNHHRAVNFFRPRQYYISLLHSQLVHEIYFRFNKTPPENHLTPLKGWEAILMWKTPPEDWVEYDREDIRRRFRKAGWKFTWTNRQPPAWIFNPPTDLPLGEVPYMLSGKNLTINNKG